MLGTTIGTLYIHPEDNAKRGCGAWTIRRFRCLRYLTFFLTSAAILTLPTAIFAESSPQIRISGAIYLGDLPTIVAERQNLFTRHGLNAVVEYNKSGKYNLQRLLAGETDFALMALTPLVLNRLTDESPGGLDDPVLLASLVHSILLDQIVMLTDSGIDSPADLQGRRVAMLKGTNAEFLWWLFAHFHGFDPLAAELQNRPIEEIPDALVNGAVDAAVIWEPWTSWLEQRLGEKLRYFPSSNVYTAKWVIVTSRRTVSERPDLCRALLRTYWEAIEFIERNPEQAIRLYSEHVDMAPSLLRRHWQTLDYDLNLDWSLVTTLQQQLDWARQVGYSTTADTVDVLSFIEAEPLHSVFPAAVGIPVTTLSSGPAAP